MFVKTMAFCGFPVDEILAARSFYSKTLGCRCRGTRSADAAHRRWLGHPGPCWSTIDDTRRKRRDLLTVADVLPENEHLTERGASPGRVEDDPPREVTVPRPAEPARRYPGVNPTRHPRFERRCTQGCSSRNPLDHDRRRPRRHPPHRRHRFRSGPSELRDRRVDQTLPVADEVDSVVGQHILDVRRAVSCGTAGSRARDVTS